MWRDVSYWEQDTFGDACDVCIIGAGITGLSTGLSLLDRQPGLRVVVVDRGFLPVGASTRNAGFACFGSPTEVLEDINRMGEDAAMRLVRDRYSGLQKLLARIPARQLDFMPCGGYEVFAGNEGEKVLDQLSYLNRLVGDVLGLKEVYALVQVPDGLRGFAAAIFTPYEGQLHAGKMIQALRNLYTSAGGQLRTGIDVREIVETAHGVRVFGHLMPPMDARQAIVTTNAFAARLLPGLEVHGARNHVLVTRPVEGLSWSGTFHFDRGYIYFRNIGNRILLGGARHLDLDSEMTETFGTNPLIVAALDRFLFDHLALPADDLIEYRWSGIIGLGPEKSPILRRVSPHILTGVRLSGMGVALASLIGESLSEEVLQHL